MALPISRIRAHIEEAAEAVGALWPLETFNSANPLSGFESRPFGDAVRQAGRLLGGVGFPSARTIRQAWERGDIAPDAINRRLRKAGINADPEAVLARLEADSGARSPGRALPLEQEAVNRHLAKWLAAFLDQGQAAWAMPHRHRGFYAAWREVVPHDASIPNITDRTDLPPTAQEALTGVLRDLPEGDWTRAFRFHLTALPGWAGFIKWRSRATHSEWQDAHPISLGEYLTVRLLVADARGASLIPAPPAGRDGRGRDGSGGDGSAEADADRLSHLWLEAWEETEREALLDRLDEAAPSPKPAARRDRDDADAPDAQWVFCIDVRSEILRRHLEAAGNHETFGYAGFFGLPIQHERYGSGIRVKACPPILDPKHRIADRRSPARTADAERYDGWMNVRGTLQALVKHLKDNLAAAFGFVEGSGAFFGTALAARTLLPEQVFHWQDRVSDWVSRPDQFCEPTIDRPASAPEDAPETAPENAPQDEPEDAPQDAPGDIPTAGGRGADDGLPLGLSHEAQVLYAEAAFRLMGWTSGFAPVIVFTGHGSQNVNNPYQAGLDCGACAGNPGGPNARVLAAICNDPEVRADLRERGIDLPDDTVVLAAEHNTTTDAVTLFVDRTDPPVDPAVLRALEADLDAAQQAAAAERADTFAPRTAESGVAETRRRAADWAETRPEWGLAGNAAFIIGPRTLTDTLDLDGRCFLHSYDWSTDDDGTSLETIMTGPLVVGEWINTQYYFSTVDNAAYGSGSKVTQNVVGTIGVYQGNGGDLMSGLPLQSVRADDDTAYHRPLRLLAVAYAPVDRVDAILNRQDQLRELFDHKWMALSVIDPSNGHRILRYQPGGTWSERDPAPARTPEPVAASV